MKDWVRKLRPFLLPGGAAVAMGMVAIPLAGPVGQAILISADESAEVCKAFLWATDYSAYKRVWNDQPPLHTALLAILFNCFGATVGVARSLAVCFGLLLLIGFFILVKKRCDVYAASLGAFCLFVAPTMLTWNVSAMLELPAIATGLWALWPIYRWTETRNWIWLVVSGLVLTAALQIKWTAAVLAPALAAEILLASQGKGAGRAKDAFRNLALWASCVAAGFLLVGLAFGIDYGTILESHFSKGTRASGSGPDFRPSFSTAYIHVEGWGGVLAGVLIVALRRDWRRLAFPLVLLATLVPVHLVHRPFWGYYYIHFALPMAWLTGCAVVELYRIGWKGRSELLRPPFVALGSLIAAGVMISCALGIGGPQLFEEIRRIRNLPRVKDDALVAEMRKYAHQTKWVMPGSIYAFHAKLPTIPELTVVPFKRFWSGQISETQYWAIVKQYRPEQLLCDPTLPNEAKEFVLSNYTVVYKDQEGGHLYLAKDLVRRAEDPTIPNIDRTNDLQASAAVQGFTTNITAVAGRTRNLRNGFIAPDPRFASEKVLASWAARRERHQRIQISKPNPIVRIMCGCGLIGALVLSSKVYRFCKGRRKLV